MVFVRTVLLLDQVDRARRCWRGRTCRVHRRRLRRTVVFGPAPVDLRSGKNSRRRKLHRPMRASEGDRTAIAPRAIAMEHGRRAAQLVLCRMLGLGRLRGQAFTNEMRTTLLPRGVPAASGAADQGSRELGLCDPPAMRFIVVIPRMRSMRNG